MTVNGFADARTTVITGSDIGVNCAAVEILAE